MKALVGAFNQEKALVGAFSVIVQPVVEPMEHYTALLLGDVVLHLGRGAQLLDRRPEEVSHELDDGALPPRPVVVLIVLALLEQLEPGQPGNPELK